MIRHPELLAKNLEETQVQICQAEELAADFWTAMGQVLYRKGSDHYGEVVNQYGYDLDEFLFGWAICTTGNLAVRCPSEEQAIRFDESYTGWGMEDTDYAYQFVLQGYRVVCCEQAHNLHQVHPRSLQQTTELAANLKRFSRKYSKEPDATTEEPTVMMALYIRFLANRYTLPELNQIALELQDVKPSTFVLDYLKLVRQQSSALLRSWS